MAENIPYWKSNLFLGAFVRKTGDEGCVVCQDENIKLSLERAPPPMRDPPAESRPKKKRAENGDRDEKPDFILNALDGAIKTVETWRKFRKWMDAPEPPAQPRVGRTPQPKREKLPEPFDIQDMPITLRRLGMWKAAKMFEKWFQGELNYSLKNEDTITEINQLGKPYPASMIDTTSISLDWVLSHPRAKSALDELTETALLTTEKAVKALKNILTRFPQQAYTDTWSWCKGDIQQLHRSFQFQKNGVESTWTKKLDQYARQLVKSYGLPDELTMILGSFNLNAAVARADVFTEGGRKFARVSHIYVYARDGFTFTDEADHVSQYLGH